jgi:glutamate carboxypeptidase
MEAYQPYLDFIDTQYEHMKQCVWDWSAINSGSYHLAGLERMLATLKDHFFWLDGEMEEISLPPQVIIDSKGDVVELPLGKALRLRKRPHAPVQLFLGGHYDTVFGQHHTFQQPRMIDENTINGPGVADLKGGLVVMLKALEALERSPYASHIGYEVLLNPDEEIGSEGSDFLLKEAAERNHIGLIYEPSLPDGTLVGERKGTGNFTVVMHGKAAHAGREHHLGRNAIVKLAEVISSIDALSGQQEGLTVNIGKVEGGDALNVVPPLAIARFNVRVQDVSQQTWLHTQLEAIIAQVNAAGDGYHASVHGRFTRPAKPMTPHATPLWNAVKSCGEMLHLPINIAASGGCCDGNNLAAYGLANIDTLGVRGGNIHSDKEYIILESLKERAKLSALLLMRLGAGDIILA